MSQQVVLNAEKREIGTKGELNKLRQAGKVPAVVYGNKEESLALVVDAKELFNATHTEHGEHTVILLQINDGEKKETKNVIVKDMQHHPVKRNTLHVDFLQISMTQEIEVTVAVETVGIPAGVDLKGGILDQVAREVTVRCLPSAIPDKFEVDVSAMDLGDAIKVSDLKVEGKVVLIDDPEKLIASVISPKVEAEPEEEVVAEEAADGQAEPEVITKGKKEGEEPEAEKGEDKPADK